MSNSNWIHFSLLFWAVPFFNTNYFTDDNSFVLHSDKTRITAHTFHSFCSVWQWPGFFLFCIYLFLRKIFSSKYNMEIQLTVFYCFLFETKRKFEVKNKEKNKVKTTTSLFFEKIIVSFIHNNVALRSFTHLCEKECIFS